MPSKRDLEGAPTGGGGTGGGRGGSGRRITTTKPTIKTKAKKALSSTAKLYVLSSLEQKKVAKPKAKISIKKGKK